VHAILQVCVCVCECVGGDRSLQVCVTVCVHVVCVCFVVVYMSVWVCGWAGVMWIYVRTKYRNGVCWTIILSNVSGGVGVGVGVGVNVYMAVCVSECVCARVFVCMCMCMCVCLCSFILCACEHVLVCVGFEGGRVVCACVLCVFAWVCVVCACMCVFCVLGCVRVVSLSSLAIARKCPSVFEGGSKENHVCAPSNVLNGPSKFSLHMCTAERRRSCSVIGH
jgi:hypothetical protein